MQGVDTQASQGINLFGDTHGSQLGGHGAADPAGEHGGGQDRSQFADQREIDDRSQARSQAQLMELTIGLYRQDHADKRAGDSNDRYTANTDGEKDRHQGAVT